MNINNLVLISDTNILRNIKDFLSSLTVIDVTFFFSVLLLMILIVTLLYFIKLNEEVKAKEDIEDLNKNINDEKVSYVDENKIVNSYDDEEGELLDLETITKALENKENNNIDLTVFEEEQEKDAIISYDELINKTKTGSINYKNESMMDDLSVKEVDLNGDMWYSFSRKNSNGISYYYAIVKKDKGYFLEYEISDYYHGDYSNGENNFCKASYDEIISSVRLK